MCLDLDREARELETESARLVREQVNMILMILIRMFLIILIRMVWMILIRMIMTILIMMIIRKRDRGTWTDCAISEGREPESRSAGRMCSTCFRLTMVMMRNEEDDEDDDVGDINDAGDCI